MGSCHRSMDDIADWYRRNHPKPLASESLFKRFLASLDDEDIEDAVIATFPKLDQK